MSELAILVPVLNRPNRVLPLLGMIRETTPLAHTLFICDDDDQAEQSSVHNGIEEFGNRSVDLLLHSGNYASKIAEGLSFVMADLYFTAADDLKPHPGWFETAKSYLKDGVQVVGVNDLIERTRDHQTHFLMTREYAKLPTIDGGPGPFHHGYSHWNCDDELIATAKHRGVYAYAPDAIVEHEHPMAGKAPDDPVYQKGRENRRLDKRMFLQRSPLWT